SGRPRARSAIAIGTWRRIRGRKASSKRIRARLLDKGGGRAAGQRNRASRRLARIAVPGERRGTRRSLQGTPMADRLPLQEGIERMRFREGYAKPVWMEPAGVYQVTIDLEATSNVFLKGHRLRVQVSSSNFPWWTGT